MKNNNPICVGDGYGGKIWYLNGKLHRTDGPAVERSTGDKAWFLYGRRHRENGPAIEWANGYKAWFFNGIEFESSHELITYKQLSLLEE